MSHVTTNQPDGVPTWIDLGIPDLERATEFYRAVLGWEFEVGSPEAGRYTMCLLNGSRVAAMMPNPDPDAKDYWWNVYLATGDCDRTVKRVTDAGGTVLTAPMDIMDQGRMALVRDPVGAQFGLWQGRAHTGCQIVNEPGSLVRNDLYTSDAGPAAEFYATVFDFARERNKELPDFTFLRRQDGHDAFGIVGGSEVGPSRWSTTFEVADIDAAIQSVTAAGGTSSLPENNGYGRVATITDPFGTEFSVFARTQAS